MLPNFLIIGATKCGTTSLFQYLAGHPQVFMHPVKELRFFTDQRTWDRGVDWYEAQFGEAGDARAVGESSNGYTRHPVYAGAPERIHRVLPGVRLLYLIRHPIQRIESHYRHRLATGMEWRPAEEALAAEPSYIAASLYGHQLNEYARYFDVKQILVLRLEDLMAKAEATSRRICDFLGIDHVPVDRFPKANVTAVRPVVPASLRRLSRFAGARKYVRLVGDGLRRSPLQFTGMAAAPAFVLSLERRAQLNALFDDDRRRLAELTGQPFDDWDLGGDSAASTPLTRPSDPLLEDVASGGRSLALDGERESG